MPAYKIVDEKSTMLTNYQTSELVNGRNNEYVSCNLPIHSHNDPKIKLKIYKSPEIEKMVISNHRATNDEMKNSEAFLEKQCKNNEEISNEGNNRAGGLAPNPDGTTMLNNIEDRSCSMGEHHININVEKCKDNKFKSFLSFNKKQHAYAQRKNDDIPNLPSSKSDKTNYKSRYMLRSASLCNVKAGTSHFNWDINDLIDLKSIETKDIYTATKITQIGSKDLKRLQIMLEFYRSEVNFLEILSILGGVYYEPLSAESIITKYDVYKIFSILPHFFAINKRFISQIANSIMEKKIVDEFINIVYEHFVDIQKSDYHECWLKFLDENISGREHLKKLLPLNPKLRYFLALVENDPRLKRMVLLDLFQTVHKHLAEYPMYFNRYLENTPPSHPQRPKILEIIQSCKEFLFKMNACIKHSQDEEKRLIFTSKIKESILSERYKQFWPLDLDINNESMKGNFNVSLETRRGVISCIFLITIQHLIIFTNKEKKIKVKPVELTSLRTAKRIFVIVVRLTNIEYIECVGENKQEIKIIVTDLIEDDQFLLKLYIDHKDQRSEFLLALKESVDNAKTVTSSKFELATIPSIYTRENYDIDKIGHQLGQISLEKKLLSQLAINYLKKLKSIQNTYSDPDVESWKKVLDGICAVLSCNYSENKFAERESVDNLITDLGAYLADISKDQNSFVNIDLAEDVHKALKIENKLSLNGEELTKSAQSLFLTDFDYKSDNSD